MAADESLDAYVFGHSEAEFDRLSLQGRLYASMTRNVLLKAGLAPGMRVLDLGCGAGDVSLLAADLVGETGSVLGVDQAPEAVLTTLQRADEAGFAWIDAEACDLAEFEPDQEFDAVIGRFVLCYVAERPILLRRLCHHLRADGVFAFFEMDISTGASHPPSPLLARCNGWIVEVMRRAGFEPDMGSRLYATLRDVGLRPTLAGFHLADGGPDTPLLIYFVEVVRSLAPMMARTGIVTEDEIDIDTLLERIRREDDVEERAWLLPRIVAAWGRRPEAF